MPIVKSVQSVFLVILAFSVESASQQTTSAFNLTTAESPGEISFQCSNGQQTASASDECNYYEDCDDGSDERNCSHNQQPVDIQTALLFSINDVNGSTSTIVKLFGNPNDYVSTINALSKQPAAAANSSDEQSSVPVILKYRSWEGVGYVNTLTVDSLTELVYFSNSRDKSIEYSSFVHSNETVETVFDAPPPATQINGIAIDWISKVLYWTDPEFRMIAALPVNSAKSHKRIWKPIVAEGLKYPQDVAVNPLSFFLFWSDGRNAEAKIERSNLAGNNRIVLMTANNGGLVSPTSLVVDLISERLYWLDADAGVVGSCRFDGSNSSNLRVLQLGLMSSMAIFENYIFLGSLSQPTIYIHDKRSGNFVANFTTLKFSGVVTGMTMYSKKAQQDSTTMCPTTDDGNYVDCEQFCWTISSTARQCDCAIGFVLTTNGTCNSQPLALNNSFLLVADIETENIFELQLTSGEISALWTIDKARSVLALALDPLRKVIYTVVGTTIFKANMNETEGAAQNFYGLSSANVRHMAVDYEHQKLYFVDGKICEISTDPTFAQSSQPCRKMNTESSTAPEAVAVDPSNGVLYWSDCSKPSSIHSVEAAFTSATNGHQTLVVNSVNDNTHGCFTNLVIDLQNYIIYWTTNWTADAGTPAVEKAYLNGTGRTTLHSDSSAKFTGLALINNYLYISDATKRSLIEYNLTSGSLTNRSLGQFTYIQGIASYAPVFAGSTTSSSVATTTTSLTKPTATKSTAIGTSRPAIQQTTGPPSNTDNTALIAGVVCGLFGFVFVLIVVAVVIKRQTGSRRFAFKPMSGENDSSRFDMDNDELYDRGAVNDGYDEFVTRVDNTKQEHSL